MVGIKKEKQQKSDRAVSTVHVAVWLIPIGCIGCTYLDHAGATVCSRSQMEEFSALVQSTLFANPHSQSTASRRTHEIIERVRQRILRSLNTTSDQYSVIFTSGATAAMKMIGETFPWSQNSEFCYTVDNHTSVLGIRQYARKAGANFSVVDHNLRCCCCPSLRQQAENRPQANFEGSDEPTFHLFAFPGESNFSGRKYNLNWVEKAGAGEIGHHANPPSGYWKILIDTTKLCASDTIDLSAFPADFVTMSFYNFLAILRGWGA